MIAAKKRRCKAGATAKGSSLSNSASVNPPITSSNNASSSDAEDTVMSDAPQMLQIPGWEHLGENIGASIDFLMAECGIEETDEETEQQEACEKQTEQQKACEKLWTQIIDFTEEQEMDIFKLKERSEIEMAVVRCMTYCYGKLKSVEDAWKQGQDMTQIQLTLGGDFQKKPEGHSAGEKRKRPEA